MMTKLTNKAVRTKKPSSVSRNTALRIRGDVYHGQGINQSPTARYIAPNDRHAQFVDAAGFYASNRYVRTIIDLKIAFAMYGFRMLPEADKGASGKWSAWYSSMRRRDIANTVKTMFRDWFVFGNVVLLWLDGDENVMVLDPAKCKFADPMGHQTLEYFPGWSAEELTVMRTENPKLAARIQKSGGTLKLSEDEGEHFRVLKSARIGDGFGVPQLYSEFPMLNQCSSMEAGEAALAHFARTPIRHHQLGHEIKNGPNAGTPRNFCNTVRAEAVKKEFNGAVGAKEIATNFDHSIKLWWVDPNLYDARKWQTIRDRVMWWAGPLGMLLAGGPVQSAPTLMSLFKTEIADLRGDVGGLVEDVFGSVAPAVPRVAWSDKCFQDMRVWAEMTKFAHQQGAIGYRTLNEECSRDDAEELARKHDERGQRADRIPLYSGAHGKSPGAASGGGRPVGTQDPPPQ